MIPLTDVQVDMAAFVWGRFSIGAPRVWAVGGGQKLGI